MSEAASSTGTSAGTGFGVEPAAMRSAISGIDSVIGGIGNTASALSSAVLAATAFAQIGQTTAAQTASLTSNQSSAISSWISKLTEISQILQKVLSAYEQADSAIAKGFGGGDSSTSGGSSASGGTSTAAQPTTLAQAGTGTSTTTTADPAQAGTTSTDPVLTAAGTHHYGDSGADVTALQQQLNAAGYNVGTADGQWGMRTTAALAQYAHDHNLTLPAQSGQVDPAVVHSIMQSEGATGSQGGRAEVYGFRDGNNNGYNQIVAARDQYGQGSAGETAVVSQAITNEASRAGATQFTDPGVQAAIISSAHMRGPGGTMAILNSMASGQTSNYTDGSLHTGTVSTLQGLTPEQFQQQFHDARVNYDLDHYIDGGRVDNGAHGTINGTTYWHGLETRYTREQQEFLQMSQQHSGN